MAAYEKPDMEITEVEQLLKKHYGRPVANVTAIAGGNLSRVFSFDEESKGYVIHFSDLLDAFDRGGYISNLLASQGVPYPRMVGQGEIGNLKYAISERVTGRILADLPNEQKSGLLPDLVQLITRMNHVDIGSSAGFGFIDANGEGTHAAWQDFLGSFFDEVQQGNFWENWTELFRTTFLERDVFDECYARMMAFSRYNAPHRYFVHSDCHAWNILSDGRNITGIIDALGQYGDFVIDLSIVEGTLPGQDVVGAIRAHQEQTGIEIPDFAERMLGARYYKGLDGLRFYAKMDRKHSYDGLRDFLLNLTR